MKRNLQGGEETKHVFIEGEAQAPVFVLLHGTGGDETSLIGIGKELAPKASLLGIKGDISEEGRTRYFHRLVEGGYDEQEMWDRGVALVDVIKTCSETYGFALDNIILVGYSNGANMAIHLLLNELITVKGVILFHSLYPMPPKSTDLHRLPVFLTFGEEDKIVSVEESHRVEEMMRASNGELTVLWTRGHLIHLKEIKEARDWLEKRWIK